jgi:pimeloyl-ACP methyl ester carboxylesterase
MTARAALPLLTVLALATAPLVGRDEKPPDGQASTPAAFEQFKRLAGEWVGKVQGKDGPQVHIQYKVTAGGSAVVETIWPGTDHEMVSVIHPDGSDLLLAHYCVHGNQPHMKASGNGQGNKIEFKFVRATNLKSEKDPHMHDVTYTFVDKDTLRTETTVFSGGKPARQAVFELKRNKSAAQLNGPVEKRSGYAPVNGLKMYYEISGTGKPAVYIHQAWSHAGAISGLTRNRQWIAVDLQGHGRTADIDRPITVEQHADDIAALLKHLEVEQADFFGDSLGGTVAVTMAVRHPELVRRVVSYVGTFVPLRGATGLTADSDPVKRQRENYKKVAPDPDHWPTLFAKVLKGAADWKGFSPEELKAIKAPVLIASGDHDFIPVERCAEWSRMIPNAQLAIIPDASHFVLMSEPEKLLPTVAAFLDAPLSKVPFGTPKTGYYPGLTR